MRKKNTPIQKPEPPRVRCADCRYFERDTTGISFDITTGVYFMGICRKGQHPDSPKKQFADRQRVCPTFSKN